MASDIDKLRAKKLADICANPVLWAKAFLRTVDNATKKVGPWTARWYQAEMLLDKSDKKVARCGRRTGGSCPSPTNCWDILRMQKESAANRPRKFGRTYRD